MNNDFKKTMEACTGACLPCTAWSGETEEIIDQAVEFAAKHGTGRPTEVYVWRESIGFQRYGAYVKEAESHQEVLTERLQSSAVDFTVAPVEGAVFAPEDEFPGATVPFAIQFVNDMYADEPAGHGRQAIFILRDWHRFINANADHVDKQLACLERLSESREKHIIALGKPTWNDENVPIELAHMMHRCSLDMPGKEERQMTAEKWRDHLKLVSPGKFPKIEAIDIHTLEMIADATGGLTRKQTENAICLSIAATGSFDVDYILNEKKNLVKQAGFDIARPSSGFERIGGLAPLKGWATRLRKRFTKEAFDYGFLNYPRGLLMAGVPGCGKSAIAKAIANEWGMNIVTVAATDLKGSLVGESEAKVATLFDVLRSAAPIIAFVDEAEKLLGKSDSVNDGGAHDAVLGQFLSFMQEDTSGVFFVFTANNMEKFAPELVDRFEGRFFIDLPSAQEREEILRIHLDLRSQATTEYDLAALVKATKDFSGRNIEDSINEAMGLAFSEDRPLLQVDLVKTFGEVIPTSKTKKSEIETMRTFVENGMMRNANSLDDVKSSKKSSMREFA